MENLIERLCQLNHIGTAKNYHTALGSFNDSGITRTFRWQ